MYLTEKVRTLQPYEIKDLETMRGKYGEFRGTQYRQSKNNDWVEVDFEYNPFDRVNVKSTIRVDTDTISATVKITRGNEVVYERRSKGTSLSKYGVLHVVVRMFLTDLYELIDRVYRSSYHMCHISTGNGPMYDDYWKFFDEDYLDKQVDVLKGDLARLNRYIDRF